MKKAEHEFCMKHFKVTIGVVLVMIVIIVGWTAWHCGNGPRRELEIALTAAATPTAPPIDLKAKMLHPYWGNCSQCHVTTGAGKPISKVMAGAPISIKAKMTHEYWGNCLLCHKVIDGVQPGAPGQTFAKAAAVNRITAQTLGLKVQSVTAAMKQQFGLFSEDGVLVLEVQPNSIGAQTGLQQGDEILRVNKVRVESVNSFGSAIADLKPGSNVSVAIYRGKKRNLVMRVPEALPAAGPTNLAVASPPHRPQPAVVPPPMTQNQVETRAEQLGVPKTQQSVNQALQMQAPANTRLVAANLNFGKVAVGSQGPGVNYPVANQFGASPYFVIYDPAQNTYSSVSNPNYRTTMGQEVQAGQYMVDLGVSNVMAGSFSPDAVNTLKSLRVTIYPGVTGSVRNVLSAYASGQLSPMMTNSNQPLGLAVGVPAKRSVGQNGQALF